MNDKYNILELRATMANQQDLIDALEHTEKRLERENEELKAKIAELQNGVLEQSVADLTRQNSGLMAQVEQYQKMFNESPDLTFDTCLTMFPDGISEVKAQAVREFARKLISATKAVDLKGKFTRTELKGAIEICIQEVNEANQLRQQAKKCGT